MKINWLKIDRTEFLNTHIVETLYFNYITEYYSGLYNYLRIGKYCIDCQENVIDCKCEKCGICVNDYCICNYATTVDFLFSFIKYNLSKSYIKEIINNLKNFSISEAEKPEYDIIFNTLKKLSK